jgi:hypothetical protein
MTDDELLRRLAWIEKADLMNRAGGALAPYWKHDAMGVHEPWNPLTRDAQAMALLRKYMTAPEHHWEWEMYQAPMKEGGYKFVVRIDGDTGERIVISESLNRAICLAIVEAHGGTER